MKLIAVGKVAEQFQVTPATVRNWVEKGYLHAVRLPSGQRRIPETEVVRMLNDLFGMPEPTEETESKKVLAVPASPDDWGPGL